MEENLDVAILGAGITGISAAISIKEKWPHCKVGVIERSSVSHGASTKNAGFACFGSFTEVKDDIGQMGIQKTFDIMKMRLEGLNILKERVPAKVMDYRNCGGYEVFDKNTFGQNVSVHDINSINELCEKKLGLKQVYHIQKNTFFDSFDEKLIYNSYEGSLNPMFMMHYLHQKASALGVLFRLNTEIERIDKEAVELLSRDQISMRAKIILVCTNGFTRRFFPELEVVPARNQVLMTKPLDNLSFDGCFHYDKGYYYFRRYGNRLLLGGARNTNPEGETTDQFGNTEEIQSVLKTFLGKINPGAENQIEHWWSGILGVGTEKAPIISWLNDRIVCGVRLGGMGVAIGSWLGETLAKEAGVKLGYTE